jgi:hypothetical protein
MIHTLRGAKHDRTLIIRGKTNYMMVIEEPGKYFTVNIGRKVDKKK